MEQWQQFFQRASPVVEISDPLFRKEGIRLCVKRDDLLHPSVSGNKWRKLKYNLHFAIRHGVEEIRSMGGVYSNHLAAVAAAGRTFGIRTSGIVRTGHIDSNNPTIRFLRTQGMHLEAVSRQEFRRLRTDIAMRSQDTGYGPLLEGNNKVLFLPEGGTNALALDGCAEIVDEVLKYEKHAPDYWMVAAGTGGTAAGIIRRLNGQAKVIVIPAVKGAFLPETIRRLLPETVTDATWTWIDDAHLGGFARYDSALIDTIFKCYRDWKMLVEPLYTGKLFHSLLQLVREGFFRKGSTVLCIHTGGLQGIAGFNARTGLSIPDRIP